MLFCGFLCASESFILLRCQLDNLSGASVRKLFRCEMVLAHDHSP